MAITEETRHRLYQRLEAVLGADEAAILMEHLPPVGWADVATKRDIDHLERRMDEMETRMELRFEALRSEMRTGLAEVRTEIHQEARKVVFLVVGAFAAISGVAFAAAGLA